MKLEAGKEMDRRCAWDWLNEVYRNPTVAFNTYSDKQQIEFAHDALVLLKKQEATLVECSAFGGMKYGGCPRCNARIDNLVNPKACGYCGQKVRWE